MNGGLRLSMGRNQGLENIAVILVSPQIPENIGAVARGMHNMGVRRLILVEPKNCDLSRIVKMATGSSIEVVEEMEVYDDFMEAVGSFEYIVGTTARIGSRRPAPVSPRALAQILIPILQNNRVAVLFGREDKGLTNDHLRYCHMLATIPTAEFTSLNLAQAVMIVCYELLLAVREPVGPPLPRLANRFELEGMYDHLRDVLMRIGFVNPQNPEHWMLNIRRFLSRIPLRARDVRIIRGVCRQIDWYSGQLENSGRKATRICNPVTAADADNEAL